MAFWKRLKNTFTRRQVDAEFFTELEETLYAADVGPKLTPLWMTEARKWKTADDVQRVLKEQMLKVLSPGTSIPETPPPGLQVVMIVGINGVGKTTTIAKLAKQLQREGKKPLLVAGDTFRAAAIEQLKVWGDRLQLEVVAKQQGSDSAATAFDGVAAAKARGNDVVLVDTAGRLHTKVPLMDELGKVKRVMGKADDGAPHEIWCVIDATTGQNAVAQVKQFHELLGLTGIILTKCDGTARAGAIFTIAQELPIPIRYYGHGEQVDDLSIFEAEAFVEKLLS